MTALGAGCSDIGSWLLKLARIISSLVFFAGFGTNSVFILALSLINLKASTVKEVYGLSTMVQFFGYIIAVLILSELSILINSISGEDKFLIGLITISPIWLVLGIFVTKPTVVKYHRNVVIQVEVSLKTPFLKE